MLALADAGLSSKGGGGNTVRNIAACPHAGVCRRETFDVTPHVISLTEYLLPDPRSYLLPRKYKIAFSGCGRDCAAATVQDLGFISKVRDGVEGFTVYLGGGMGTKSRVGVLLEEFIPVTQVCRVAEAVKRVFDQHGNRENRQRARIRFLVEEMGLDQFKSFYQAELKQLLAARTEIPIVAVPRQTAGTVPSSPRADFAPWQASYVRAQKQQGYFTVEFAPPLGNIAAEHLVALAGIVERYGEGILRVTNWQGAILRWVAEEQLPALHEALAALDLGAEQSKLLSRMVTCTGAAICRLGICPSRELATAITSAVTQSDLSLDVGVAAVRLHISGCPNACGRHPIAQIGFYGVARTIDGQRVPHYFLQLGGHVEEGYTRLAEGTTVLPAHNIPAFLLELLQAFQSSPHHTDFDAFLANGGRLAAEEMALHYQ